VGNEVSSQQILGNKHPNRHSTAKQRNLGGTGRIETLAQLRKIRTFGFASERIKTTYRSVNGSQGVRTNERSAGWMDLQSTEAVSGRRRAATATAAGEGSDDWWIWIEVARRVMRRDRSPKIGDEKIVGVDLFNWALGRAFKRPIRNRRNFINNPFLKIKNISRFFLKKYTSDSRNYIFPPSHTSPLTSNFKTTPNFKRLGVQGILKYFS
jgi:hypothetical protein